MAIEVNKRKRKHKNDVNVDEDDDVNVVPKKIAKKNKTPKKLKQQEETQSSKHEGNIDEQSTTGGTEQEPAKDEYQELNEDDAAEELCHDSGFEPDEKEVKFSKDFKMLNFRAKLRGTNFITELRHLLHLTQSRPKIIAKYIEKRGKPLELAEALERIDKTNVLHVAYLCQALQLVVMEILTNQKSHLESAEHACRYFLKAHGGVLELLLKSSNLQHRRIALKLLTAIVCVEPQLGRQLLSSYDILSNVKTIENFLSHSKYELNAEDTVRKCFIHFVLAYLVDGNILLIRNILDRPTLICALASGLQYDDHVTVCVVLSTLKKYVLECLDISKTKKIHVFDLDCCKHFLRLYDWLGPKAYAAKVGGGGGGGKNGGTQVMTLQQQQAFVDAQELEAVAAAGHEFLVMLLTSRKFGITFDAMTHFRQKHNVIQGKLIGFLFKPWCDARKTELIIKIITACPDLARHTVRNFAGIVNPMRTPQRDWIDACNFLTQLINTMHPNLLRNALNKITLTDFTYWIKDICLPIEVLLHINGSKTLRHPNFDFRFATNRLLLTMFTQYSNYLEAIIKREQSKGSNTLRRFRFDILNHILVNFPTMEDILYSLFLTTQMKTVQDQSKVLNHLEVTLDLVLTICKEHRTFINKTGTILDYLNMLRPLYANDDETHNIKLELKAIKTILLLFPRALEPRQELFSSVLKSFLKAFVNADAEVQRESGELLRNIFKNTGLFDAGELEIDLWLEALRFFDGETVDVVANVFIEVLKVTKANVDMPKTADSNCNEKNLQQLFENIEQGLSVQAYIETLSISKLMPLIFKGVQIVPPLDKYLETVCLLMFHYYPTPEHVLQLYVTEFKSLKTYMNDWLQIDDSGDSTTTLVVGKIATHVPKLQELQSIILMEGGGKKFEELFAGTDDDTFEFDYNGKIHNFSNILKNEGMILIYSQAILFIVAQLVAKQKLQHSQAVQAASYLKSLIKIAAQHTAAAAASTVIETTENISFLAQLLKYIYSTRISHISNAEIFNTTHDSNVNYLKFLADITESCNQIEIFAHYAANYRLKIVKAVEISMQNIASTIAQTEKLTVSLRLLQAFCLNAENCVDILNLFARKLKYNDYFCAETSQKTFYYELLVLLLQRLIALQNAVDCAEFMRKFGKCYTNWLRKLNANELNLEPLEDALQQFLQISHQHITQLDGKFFDAFFVERKLNKASVKLACLLLERNVKLKVNFLAQLPHNFAKKELIYPLLKIAFQRQFEIDSTLLQSIYQEYKNGFMRTIEKPQKAANIYKENVEASIALIEHCMPKSECIDFCNKNFKFDAIELYQMKVINAIYKKALTTLEGGASNAKQHGVVFVNYINLQVQMLSVDLKKQTLDYEKIAHIAHFIAEWYAHAQTDVVYDFTKILNSQQWLNYCKTTLKLGMHISDEGTAGDSTELQKADAYNGLLLKLLAYLCGRLYLDFNPELPDVQEPAEPAQLFELIFTHSKFYDIVLNAQHAAVPSQVKTEVLHLLFVLAQKSPTQSLRNKQIPVILGAYQAKLNAADRYTLALLQLYEHWDCGLQQYRPFIWGESAIAFYALRAADEDSAKLTQQETSIAQVMSLIDRQVCEYTLDNFPIWRKLQAAQQLPELQFLSPAQRAVTFGANELERRIELQQAEEPAFSVADLRLCPKREAIFEQCYDPAFFIPLMNICFAPEAYSHPARPVQNGLLSMVFAALSSQDKEMRLAAGCAQLRYRAHFESNKFFERPLWIQTYENIQAGLNDLRLNWMKHKRNSGTPRVPYISGLFVAKTFNLTTEPTHLLYKQLTMFLRLKSSFNFQSVPEFNILFYSPEVEHQSFRQFIVEVIRNGIKSSSDLFLLVTTNTFKVLMGFYGSPMSTLDMNLLILSVFSTCVKIPASTKIMIENVGLLPWLAAIMGTLEFYHFDVIEGLISIINNLWYALKANAEEFHNYQHICSDIHRLLLLLLPHISPRISAAGFSKLLNILHKTAQPQHYLAISAAQLDKVISCAQQNYPTWIFTISGVRKFGGCGAESKQQYCQRLFDQELDMVAILALSSLRSYVIDWWQCCVQESESVILAETIGKDDLNAAAVV